MRLTEADLSAYDWRTHTLCLTPAAANRIRSEWAAGGARGTFGVQARGELCYQGRFMLDIESNMPSEPYVYVSAHTMFFNWGDRLPEHGPAITILWQARQGDRLADPRADSRVKAAREEAGLLRK
jgi:hypothetical protein